MIRFFLASILIILEFSCLASIVGCYPNEIVGQREATLRTVEVAMVTARPESETVTLIGRTEPWREATLYFEVSGVIADVHVDEGDLVDGSKPIARLMLRDYELACAQAEADLGAADAKLDLLLAGTRSEDIAAAKANHERAKIEEGYLVSEARRAKELLNKGGGSDFEVDKTERSRLAAIEGTRAMKALLDRALAGPRAEEVQAARAESKSRQQMLALAVRQLEKATLNAPFRGLIEKRFVDPGAFVSIYPTGGVPIVHLVDLDTVDAVISVPEAALSKIAKQQDVEIRSVADAMVSGVGRVLSVGQVADPESGTYEMRVRLANPIGAFRGGMVVSASIQSGSPRAVIRVPSASLQRPYGQPPMVLLVDSEQGRVISRRVKIGPIQEDEVEIMDGLSEGELLIVSGQHLVIEGDLVAYRKQTPIPTKPLQ